LLVSSKTCRRAEERVRNEEKSIKSSMVNRDQHPLYLTSFTIVNLYFVRISGTIESLRNNHKFKPKLLEIKTDFLSGVNVDADAELKNQIGSIRLGISFALHFSHSYAE